MRDRTIKPRRGRTSRFTLIVVSSATGLLLGMYLGLLAGIKQVQDGVAPMTTQGIDISQLCNNPGLQFVSGRAQLCD